MIEALSFGPLFLACAIAASMGSVRIGGVVIGMPSLVSLAIYVAACRDGWRAVVELLLAGLVADALSLFPLGLSPGVFVVLGAVLMRWRDLIFLEQWLSQAVLGLAGGMLYALAEGVVYALGGQMPPLALAVRVVAYSGVAAAIVTPVVFWLGFRLDGLLLGMASHRRVV